MKQALPQETAEDRRAQATIGEADIVAVRQLVEGMTRPGMMMRGPSLDEAQRVSAEAAKQFWTAPSA